MSRFGTGGRIGRIGLVSESAVKFIAEFGAAALVKGLRQYFFK